MSLLFQCDGGIIVQVPNSNNVIHGLLASGISSELDDSRADTVVGE